MVPNICISPPSREPLTRCKRHCCGKAFWYWAINQQTNEKYQALVPLKDVVINGTLNGTISTVNVQLGYVNASEDQPIECTFDFPVNSKSIVSSLSARIGDKLIEASIREKEEAKEKYDDAIAAGNAAVLAEKSDTKKNCISLKLGNLLPGQEATINMVLLEEIEIIGASFSYTLPASFYPDYNKHSSNKELKHTYGLNFEYKIISGDKINYLSVPKAAQSSFNPDKTEVTIKGGKKSKNIRFFYRSQQMLRPRLLYEENK